MARVEGINGVFIQADDPAALRAWYVRNFGIELHGSDEGRTYFMEFLGRDHADPSKRANVVFAIMPAQHPRGLERGEYVINYRVDDLRAFLHQLERNGVETQDIKEEDDGYNGGLFTWIRDLEGNRIELYQPL